LINEQEESGDAQEKVKDPIVSLVGADVRGAYLGDANLVGIPREGPKVTASSTTGTNASTEAPEENTPFQGEPPTTTPTHLSEQNTPTGPGVDLSGANLSFADLSDTILTDANLAGANLNNADLTSADLNNANLTDTTLYGARLDGAVLTGVEGTNEEALRKQARSLKSTIMPDGSQLGQQGTRPQQADPEAEERFHHPSDKLFPNSGVPAGESGERSP